MDAEELLKFKSLLDAGAITQAEYDEKKRLVLTGEKLKRSRNLCENCQKIITPGARQVNGPKGAYCSDECLAKTHANEASENKFAMVVIAVVILGLLWGIATPSGRDFLASFASPPSSRANR